MIHLKITGSGLLDPRQFDSWRRDTYRDMMAGVARGMQAAGKIITPQLRTHAQTRLKVRNRGFISSFKHKVFSRDAYRMPSMLIGSRVNWSGVHEDGATIAGKLLIPINLKKRIGRKTFRLLVERLMRSGNAFFKKTRGGQVVLFAENIKENNAELSRFKSGLREKIRAHGRKARLARGTSVPIAVLVSRVRVPRRLGVADLVRQNLPMIASMIEQNMRLT